MFFDHNRLAVSILDVMELKQANVSVSNSKRPFSAISFRSGADTVIHAGETDHILTDGAVCFIPAGLSYTRKAVKDELIVIHFEIANDSFGRMEVFFPKEPEQFFSLFRELLHCWRRKETGYEYICTSLLYHILALCRQETYTEQESQSPISPSVEYMKHHFQDARLTIAEAAQKSYISTVYFRKLFKKQYGVSPVQYLIRLRMEHAVSLMETGYYPLQEVAKRSGYEDYSYFSSEFKRIKGISPSDFIKHDR